MEAESWLSQQLILYNSCVMKNTFLREFRIIEVKELEGGKAKHMGEWMNR